MRNAANLSTIQALRDTKAAVIEFADEVRLAVSEAHAEVQKTMFWLENDRVGYWRAEVRRSNDKVQQAKSDLYRAQMQSSDERPSCMVERKALARAEDRLREAQAKVESTRRWVRMLDREAMLFKAALSSFGTMVDVDLPRAVAHLEQLMDHVDAYRRLSAPSTPEPDSGGSGDGDGGGAG